MDTISNAAGEHDLLAKSTMSNTMVAVEQDSYATGAFPLLDLPPELWSRICRMAATYDEEIDLYDFKTIKSKLRFQSRVEQPPITRVCTLIRNEILSSFYRLNTFVIAACANNLPGLCAWTCAIGSDNVKHIRHLYLEDAREGVVRYDEVLRGSCGIPLGIQDVKPMHDVTEEDGESEDDEASDNEGNGDDSDEEDDIEEECWRYHIGVLSPDYEARHDLWES